MRWGLSLQVAKQAISPVALTAERIVAAVPTPSCAPSVPAAGYMTSRNPWDSETLGKLTMDCQESIADQR